MWQFVGQEQSCSVFAHDQGLFVWAAPRELSKELAWLFDGQTKVSIWQYSVETFR